MSAAITARRLSESVGQTTRSSRFCVAGVLPGVDPGLVVDRLGAVRFRLRPRKYSHR